MSAAESATSIQKNQVDLLDFIDWSGLECLNQSSSHSLSNALKQGYREDEGLNLESDADEQLLIYIPFTQVIKLHSIVVTGSEEEGPKTVKLFANREHMGFSNVSDFPPSDTAVLSPDNLKVALLCLSFHRELINLITFTISSSFQGKPVVLKYVKFQNVRSLTIFIEDNQSSSEITKVQKIALYGSTVETTDMKGLKKIEDH
ncbi:PITH domain-containing protein At3g04780 isoform X1 [Hibiscus syriacus]|uniref:PITH domain-containing protein At3g04780 isoform X1 n=1 Tax=Hibiscus syriacus TaxID=106335 RepID=UPI001924049F|nr:PITH domain-containing protein At3g04780 isoform X1 [Hibiscus syriacus]